MFKPDQIPARRRGREYNVPTLTKNLFAVVNHWQRLENQFSPVVMSNPLSGGTSSSALLHVGHPILPSAGGRGNFFTLIPSGQAHTPYTHPALSMYSQGTGHGPQLHQGLGFYHGPR